jgi:FlaA1/EpsC-like NDP-sugar epimerase
MKVLITGATGKVGKEAIEQCLARPEITFVVAISRKELSKELIVNTKLRSVILKDFYGLE